MHEARPSDCLILDQSMNIPNSCTCGFSLGIGNDSLLLAYDTGPWISFYCQDVSITSNNNNILCASDWLNDMHSNFVLMMLNVLEVTLSFLYSCRTIV